MLDEKESIIIKFDKEIDDLQEIIVNGLKCPTFISTNIHLMHEEIINQIGYLYPTRQSTFSELTNLISTQKANINDILSNIDELKEYAEDLAQLLIVLKTHNDTAKPTPNSKL